jgi:N-acetylglucosamine malate deacetylase 1
MTDVRRWVAQFAALAEAGHGLAALPAKSGRVATQSGPCCVMLSPHPDDECIVGALPLRLLRQGGWRVVNIAVTHGSKPERQLARASELQAACAVLGFDNVLLAARGLLRVALHSRANEPAHWAACVAAVAAHLDRLRPELLVFPHPDDAQAAHRGTCQLALDALTTLPHSYTPLLAYSEYWSTMQSPNLMVQVSEDELAVLVSALMQHAGEISRNPYHLGLPAWMMDNVRRGAEQVGEAGSAAPAFRFATLYRVMRWQAGVAAPAWAGGRFAPVGEPIALRPESAG